ncbi:MAG: glucose-6-phosphate dehydrogenase [Candidatus Binataceae bacterium]
MAETTARPREIVRSDAARAAYPPCAVVIFGGAGDLSHRKLLPALYNLSIDGELPEKLAIVGFSMEELNDDSYREFARSGIAQFSRRKIDDEHWRSFAAKLRYQRGNFSQQQDFAALAKRLADLDRDVGCAGNRVFYFAIPPQFIDAACDGLASAGMIQPVDGGKAFTRVVVEKPVGDDLKSASEINQRLARYFDESQTFRIDHYLGKETVENLMVLRFANAIFEPIWNSKFIDHIQITVAEEEGVGTRAGYYDKAGALRDMVQSHLLQVLCMVSSEPPRTTDADAVRDTKLDLLKSLRPLSREDIEKWVVRGQYGEGLVGGRPVKAYRAEDHVPPSSNTETFVALRAWVDNWRWAGVPFYLRTGKRMPKRASEIAIVCKSVPRILYNALPGAPLPPNMYIVSIQPDEGLGVSIVSKVPGAQRKLTQVQVDFHYATASPEAYETLLRDVILGDQTLFMRRDTVEAAWQFVQPILDAWAEAPSEPAPYAAGSWGPLEAALMIAADGRSWRTF